MTMVDFADAIGLRAAMERSDDEPAPGRDGAALVVEPAPVEPEAPESQPQPPDAEAQPDVSPVAAARARLAARGLLQTQPAVVVPKGGRTAAGSTPLREVEARDARGAHDEPNHWAAAAEDAWDVEPGGPEVAVPCPQCRQVIQRPLESTRVVCGPCDRAWRWATCAGCDTLTLTVERQESWRCAPCGQFTRSWWRTPAARREAAHVVARRKHEAMLQERARVRAGMRKRRWKLVAFAVTASVVTAAAVFAVRAAEPRTRTGTDAVCERVARLGPALGERLDAELPALEAEAVGAAPEVARAVEGLRSAERPGSASFLVARTALVDACTLVQER